MERCTLVATSLLCGVVAASPAAQAWLGDGLIPDFATSAALPYTGGLGPPPRLVGPEPRVLQSFISAESELSVDTRSRYQVADLFNTVYRPALAVPMDWDGVLSSCLAGTTSLPYAQATLDLVNYFRAMAGLPADIFENSANSAKAQEAALMMNAEGALSHSPSTGWTCYSQDGATAAGKSNLALGAAGPAAIALYMQDPGSSNYFVGHRRWILYPPQREMGTGSTGGTVSHYRGANALWVLTGFGSRPPAPEWIAWPPAGYVPYQLTFPRWSFSVNAPPSEVDFGNATVSMSHQGGAVPLTLQSERTGYADDTLVWEPTAAGGGPGLEDRTFHVTVHDVRVGGIAVDYTYDVTVFDPDLLLCHAADDRLDLPFTQVDSAATFEACSEIRAEQGLVIDASGTAVFRAPVVVFGGGFSVQMGANVRIISEIP